MDRKIFTEDEYLGAIIEGGRLLTRENNKLVYDLLSGELMAIPENEFYDLTVTVAIRNHEDFLDYYNTYTKLEEYLSDIEIGLGTKHFVSKRLRKLAKELYNKENLRFYDKVNEILERNNYDIEKSIGQYMKYLEQLQRRN